MKNRASCGPSPGGFTLVELLVVMAIIGILISLLLPALTQAVVAGKVAATARTLQGLGAALESFKKDWGSYPPSDNTHENGSAYPKYGYECLAYYLLGPEQKGWGSLYQTGTPAHGTPPFTGLATSPYPPYLTLDRSGDLFIGDNDPGLPASLAFVDGFTPGKRIQYYRFEATDNPPGYNVKNCTDYKLKKLESEDTHYQNSCSLSFYTQAQFEMLVKPKGKWVREDYLLISCGVDRYWGPVQPKDPGNSGQMTGRMYPPVGSYTTDVSCDDICNFNH
jgi:prepilin-type N-terminal cleavage/methylation domain-containing protein